jgi:2'-5' RNA ligase
MKKEYVVVALLDTADIGDRLVQWPLHLTIVPWFSYYEPEKFLDEVRNIVNQTSAIDLQVSSQTTWGYNTVNTVQYSISLHRLHEDLLKLAMKHGRMNRTGNDYHGRSYTPHITHQGRSRVNEGQRIKIETVYVVERDMSHHVKTVIEKIDLK